MGAENPGAAAHIARALIAAGDGLIAFPGRGRPSAAHPGLRELTVVRPYLIIYGLAGRAVSIFWVRHAAQLRP